MAYLPHPSTLMTLLLLLLLSLQPSYAKRLRLGPCPQYQSETGFTNQRVAELQGSGRYSVLLSLNPNLECMSFNFIDDFRLRFNFKDMRRRHPILESERGRYIASPTHYRKKGYLKIDMNRNGVLGCNPFGPVRLIPLLFTDTYEVWSSCTSLLAVHIEHLFVLVHEPVSQRCDNCTSHSTISDSATFNDVSSHPATSTDSQSTNDVTSLTGISAGSQSTNDVTRLPTTSAESQSTIDVTRLPTTSTEFQSTNDVTSLTATSTDSQSTNDFTKLPTTSTESQSTNDVTSVPAISTNSQSTNDATSPPIISTNSSLLSSPSHNYITIRLARVSAVTPIDQPTEGQDGVQEAVSSDDKQDVKLDVKRVVKRDVAGVESGFRTRAERRALAADIRDDLIARGFPRANVLRLKYDNCDD